MAIQKLHVKGYRSLRDVSWEPGNLNIVIGPNGSGKSNLMRLLELISNSAKGNLQQHIRHEGGSAAISWDGKDDGAGIQLITTDYGTLQHDDKDSASKSLFTYNLTFGNFYGINDCVILEALRILKEKDNSQQDDITLIKRMFSEPSQIYDEQKQTTIEFKEDVKYQETLLSVLKGPLPQFLTMQLYRNALSNWSFYHYLRTDLDAPIRKPSFTKYDPEIQSDGSNLVSVLHTLYTEDKDFKNNIDLAMKSAFGDEYVELTFGPAADNQIQFRIRWKSLDKPVSSFNLSDGTLRFLFLITILANPKAPSLIAIDEPETGLHPSMMSIIADYAVIASQRTQVIITTHSADFLDGFHDTTPTITVSECIDGETKLRIPSEDKLKSWLEEYTLGETFRMRQLEDL